MKTVLLACFSISFLFASELMANNSQQRFIEAVKSLNGNLSRYNDDSTNLSPFKESELLKSKQKKGLKKFLDDPLRSANVEDYKLKGLMWKTNIPKAIVKDTLGKMHILKVGDYLGVNQGQIIHIREGEVVVLELKEGGGDDGPTYSTKVLTFSEPQLNGKEKNKQIGQGKQAEQAEQEEQEEQAEQERQAEQTGRKNR
ncbi:MAG: pilus assembly protein PilP [Bdellovibrionaceae bacterium]|nr:pilus assembly protein PilP [Pseudobdellovibrionaceae bacterium]